MKAKRSRSDLSIWSNNDDPVDSSTDKTTSDEDCDEPRKKVIRPTANGPDEKPPSSTVIKQEGHSGGVVFTIEPFETENGDTNKPTHILDKCHFCKRVLSEGIDIFMLSCFIAFCTPECRLLYAAKEIIAKKKRTL